MRAEELFTEYMTGEETNPRDADMRTTCLSCGTTQTLAEAIFNEGAGEATYTCRNLCQPLLIISVARSDAKPWPGRGFRITTHVFRNPADVLIQAPDWQNVILVPASPNALADESEAPPG